MMQIINKLKLLPKIPMRYWRDYINSFNNELFIENNPLPWMNYRAVAHIQNYLKNNAKVFEYGSGSSTRYWTTRGCSIVSIEHDELFYEKMKSVLDGCCDYRLIKPVLDEGVRYKSFDMADNYKSSDYEEYSFEHYVRSIDKFPDCFFDMVVVDGRARPSCIKHAVPKIKQGGILVLDNSDRDYYLKNNLFLLDGWSRKTYKGPVRGLLHEEETSIFYKPN